MIGVTNLDESAVVEPAGAIAQASHQGGVVAHEHDRGAVLAATDACDPCIERWNSSSPTAMTSSTSKISRLTLTATAKPSRTYMPLE